MKKYKIAIIPGDGIGPEVVYQAERVLDLISQLWGFKVEKKYFDFGGEVYLKEERLVTDEDIDELRKFDAILFGAIGHPEVKPGILEKGVLLKIRFDLDLYINLRPVKLYSEKHCPIKGKRPEDIDFVVVRENTEGLYVGSGGFIRKGTPYEVAIQESINTRMGVERCIRYAFEYCRKRGKKKKVTLCGKTNVLTYAFDLWERVFYEVGEEYPDIEKDYGHVDAICMWMVKNPERFDVIVTDNMFGDIITDLGAIIQGGMGIAAGGNINPQGTSMFEPIGGSAPKYAGKGVINPLAAIAALQMMLDFLGEKEAAEDLENSISKVAEKLESLDAGRMGYSTEAVGDLVMENLKGPQQK